MDKTSTTLGDPAILWTPEQVDALAAWQANSRYHPFTCPGENPCCKGARKLIPTQHGWVCSCGEYRQTWAHDFMLLEEKMGMPSPDDFVPEVADFFRPVVQAMFASTIEALNDLRKQPTVAPKRGKGGAKSARR